MQWYVILTYISKTLKRQKMGLTRSRLSQLSFTQEVLVSREQLIQLRIAIMIGPEHSKRSPETQLPGEA